MDTTIKLIPGVEGGRHVYFMDISKKPTENSIQNFRFTFEGTELGWLQAETTIDNLKDSLTEVEVIDETSDPR